MRYRLIPLLFLLTGLAVAQQQPTTTTGINPPTTGTCNDQSQVGNLYILRADPATSFSGPYMCLQTGPFRAGTTKFGWVALGQNNGSPGGPAGGVLSGTYPNPGFAISPLVNPLTAAGQFIGSGSSSSGVASAINGGAILTNSTTATLRDYPSIKDPPFGAKGDEVAVTGCTVSASSSNVTCSGGAFVQADVGKTVWFYTTTNAPYTLSYTTTITAVTDATHIVTTGASSGALSNVYGGYATDDTAAFQAYATYAGAQARKDATPSSDGNRLGSVRITIPAGSYLITSPEAMMTSAYSTRTFGLLIEGAGKGTTMIDYRPATPGPLFSNNDAWLTLTIRNIAFTGNDSNSDFMASLSNGGAQDYFYENVIWRGTWRYGWNLTGTNNNSEWKWESVSFQGDWNTVFFVGASSTTDQFLNYWWNHMSMDIHSGNFINATFGGSFKITNSDFSGLTGSGNPASPNILFALRGNNHILGVTSFVAENDRFELKTNSIVVLYSEWGGYGQVSFTDCDFSSQKNNVSPPINEFEINLIGATGAANYHFARSTLMGSVLIDVGTADWGYRRNITFEDVQFINYDDYSQAVNFAALSGTNFGGYPIVECIRCRGADLNPRNSFSVWAPTTVYAASANVYANGYEYTTTAGGTSGSTAPNGRTTSFNDGGVTWATVDNYFGDQYVQTSELRPVTNVTNGYSSALKFAVTGDRNNSNYLPARISASVVGFNSVILPPFATVSRIQLNVPTSASCTQATVGTFVVRNNNYSPTTFFTQPLNPLSAGGSIDYSPTNYYNAGTDIGSRTIVLQANTDVTQNCPGSFVVWYF